MNIKQLSRDFSMVLNQVELLAHDCLSVSTLNSSDFEILFRFFDS